MYLPIDVALTEDELARDFVAAVSARQIPEKFFYWFPLSVRAWLALCGEGAYRNFSRSHQVITEHASDVASLVSPGEVEVVSLGAGQGDKDRVIVRALIARGAAARYRPVDASLGLLEIAVGDARREGIDARGLKADFTERSQLRELLSDGAGQWRGLGGSRGSGGSRLILLLGNTLGGFDPARMARDLAALMREGDLAVVDGELFAGASTLAGYDNPINRQFAFSPLAGAGLVPDDGQLEFRIGQDRSRSGLHRVDKSFTASRPAVLHVAGETVALSPGERIEMSSSHKYDEPTFLALLAEAGLTPRASYRSADGRLLMAVVERETTSAGRKS